MKKRGRVEFGLPIRLIGWAMVLLVLATAGSCARKAAAPGQDKNAERAAILPDANISPALPYPARGRGELPPIVVPQRPEVIPGYTELDPETGLHMTGEPVSIDLKTWRLEISGAVRHPMKLSYDELRMLPGLRQTATIVCPGYFEDRAEWAGASIEAILRLADPLPSAGTLDLFSADGYSTSVDIAAARESGFLAYALRDGPIPVLHGFPLRAVFPAMQGAKWVKWLVAIKVK